MRVLLASSLAAALLVPSGGLTASTAAAADGSVSKSTTPEEFLFTVQAARGSTASLTVTGAEDETFTLTLSGVDPVTMFSDRPFRDARLISPTALAVNWDAMFGDVPPNAVLTYARPGKAPGSMVIELTNAIYSRATRTLSFTAIREARKHDPVEKGANWQRRTTPLAMTSVSLFIDMVSAKPQPPDASPAGPSTGSTKNEV